MRTSTLTHLKNDNLIIVRESYTKICKDLNTGILLSYFEYWHNVKSSMRTKAIQSNDVAEAHGDNRTQDETLLQFHTNEEIYEDLMGIMSIKAIRTARTILKELGFVSEHKNPNPRYTFDKTVFYQLHPNVINNALYQLDRRSQEKTHDTDETSQSIRQNVPTVRTKRPNGTDETSATIPETSSETSTEIIPLVPPGKQIKSKIRFNIPNNLHPALIETLRDWAIYKSQLPKAKQYSTQIGWDKFISETIRNASIKGYVNVINRINEAIAAGWQGTNYSTMPMNNSMYAGTKTVSEINMENLREYSNGKCFSSSK